jgi:hypothetical protein
LKKRQGGTVAKLSKDEQATLDALIARQKEPERGSGNHRLEARIDLSDDKAVKRAIKLGLIDDPDEEETETTEEENEEEESEEEVPKTRGFFDK